MPKFSVPKISISTSAEEKSKISVSTKSSLRFFGKIFELRPGWSSLFLLWWYFRSVSMSEENKLIENFYFGGHLQIAIDVFLKFSTIVI